MTTSYEHTQKGYPLFYFGIPLMAIVVILVPYAIFKTTTGESESVVVNVLPGALMLSLWCTVPVLLWAGLLLSHLTVWIDSDYVRLRFGFGTWRKKFPLNQIQSAQAIRNDFFMGWGIHWIGAGWLYNIAGMEAVELTFKNGKKNRIGTDQPEKLAAAIKSAIKENCKRSQLFI